MQEFYRLLIKVFHKQDLGFNTNIIRHLSAFGADALEYKCLFQIEGADGKGLGKYRSNLMGSPCKEGQI